jgi:hypothetical protein
MAKRQANAPTARDPDADGKSVIERPSSATAATTFNKVRALTRLGEVERSARDYLDGTGIYAIGPPTVPHPEDISLVEGIRERAEAVLAKVQRLRSAADEGNLWAAVWHALELDQANLQQLLLRDFRRQKERLREQAPDADRGRRSRVGAHAGGRAKRGSLKGPPDAELQMEVRTLHKRSPRLSRSAVCERVGQHHGLSRKTVQKRVASEPW